MNPAVFDPSDPTLSGGIPGASRLIATPPGHRSGYVTLLGRPNVGKSTLLNRLLGTKLAIVSGKPQTTRNRIVGVRTEPGCQIVFLDTPGIHKPKEALNRFMVKEALGSIADADIAVVLVAADESIGKGDQFVVERVREAEIPFVMVLNKIDLVAPTKLQVLWEKLHRVGQGALDLIALSALKDSGVSALLALLKAHLPEGPMFYPADTVTDRSLKFLLAELIREQVFEHTREELPYASAVHIAEVDRRDGEEPSVVKATLAVENPSQKGIVIGKKGEMLKRIGTAARREMEKLLETKVYLELHVEVAKGWRRDPKELRKLGYTEEEI
ncbi:MAG: GTPase Era [Candidatus Omnitrophica bacterium]|nr:GTPase Era [Candidatus Omnitrophota bacterium]